MVFLTGISYKQIHPCCFKSIRHTISMYTYIHTQLVLSRSYSAFLSPNNLYSSASLKPAKKNLRKKTLDTYLIYKIINTFLPFLDG